MPKVATVSAEARQVLPLPPMRGSELEDEMITLTQVTFEREFGGTAIRWQGIGYSPEGVTTYMTLFSPEDTDVIDSILGINTVKRRPMRGWEYCDWQQHTVNDLYVPVTVTGKIDARWGLRPKAYEIAPNKWITPEDFAKRKEQQREYAKTT